MSAEIYEYLLFARNYLDINCDFHRPSGYKQLFKTLTNSCLRLFQIKTPDFSGENKLKRDKKFKKTIYFII